ncbi:MAG: carboxypeptidase-like regulatory domain-containing protein, partial [Nitrospinaceae bacterium]
AFVKPGSEEFTIKCNLHPFLQTQGLFVDNPYLSTTDAAGRFRIQDIPPGTYDVLAWHPLIPSQHGRITVTPGGRVTQDFSFAGEAVRRKLYQNDTKGYRFNTWYESGEKFYGGKRVDDPVEILQQFDNSRRYQEGDAYFEDRAD